MNSVSEEAKDLYYQVLDEDKISWQMQNQIHWLLNECYEGLSTSFIAKTYRKDLPQKRILLFRNKKLIGHLGLFLRYLHVGTEKIPFLGFGLFAVCKNNPGFGNLLLQSGLEEAANQQLDFGIGRTCNKTVILLSKNMRAKVCAAKLVAATNEKSKDGDVVIFYPICSDKKISKIIANAEVNNEFRMSGGELF